MEGGKGFFLAKRLHIIRYARFLSVMQRVATTANPDVMRSVRTVFTFFNQLTDLT